MAASEHVVSTVAKQAYEAAAPILSAVSPVVERAKAGLPHELVERLEGAAAQASSFSASLLESADAAAGTVQTRFLDTAESVRTAAEQLRRSPDFLKAKAAEADEYVKAKVAEADEFVKAKVAAGRSYIPAVPTSLAGLRAAGEEQLANLKAAVAKLRASLPASLSEIKLPEEQVERIRGSIGKVLESLPKLPAFELPKIDLAKYNSAELVKFGQKLLDQLTPYVAPYQERVQKLLTDYKVQERAAVLQKQAVDVYKKYNLEKVVPTYVNSFIVGEQAAPAVAAQ